MARADAAARTLVKVCGITRLEDARVALGAGADWLGFVVKAKGPRLVPPERVAEMLRELPGATAVAVMVSPTPEEALALAARAGAGRIQLHRVDPAAWPAAFPVPLTFSVPVTVSGALAGRLPAEPHLVMLDSADEILAGGTGRSFPWQVAASLAVTRPVMLAGGLDADNVAVAIERARPFGVDASSRLEAAPGLKDPERVRRFVAAVREADAVRRRAAAARGDARP